MTTARFTQLDVFASGPFSGNPLAVIHDADDLTGEQMAAIARWTNLSETTFLLTPTDPAADYRVRIFTASRELPFAGHPTLGTAQAWLLAGGSPAGEELVQECGVGLVRVRRAGDDLAFAAPALQRSGAVSEGDRAAVLAALRVDPASVVDLAWCDNGPGWLGVLVDDARTVLGLRPDPVAMAGWKVGVVGPYGDGTVPASGGPADVEVRAFFADPNFVEDPVTGSLNAALAQWLIGAGRLPERYVAAQGTALQRAGRVRIHADGDDIWVAGAAVERITGTIALP